jgi:hypothetical protein
MMQMIKQRQLWAVGGAVLFVVLVAFSWPFQSQTKASQKPKLFDVILKIDFGLAGKPIHEGKLEVEEGTTPNEVVSRVFPIRSGMSCCSLRELIEIDGVAIDPAKNRWWICSINGTKKMAGPPHRTQLKVGDVVEWKFIEDSQ